MIREDKEVKDEKIIENILYEADHCMIALCDHNNPYLVPMNFGFKDNNLYLHSSNKGRKIEILNENNKVSFGIEIKSELVKSKNPCNWGMKYMSVLGFGIAHFIEDNDEKIEALDIIMSKYSDNDNEEDYQYSNTALNRTVVIKIELRELTCKISGY
jgi:uncharacterized protein